MAPHVMMNGRHLHVLVVVTYEMMIWRRTSEAEDVQRQAVFDAERHPGLLGPQAR